MAEVRVSIRAMIGLAYRDTMRVLSTMPQLLLIGLIMSIAFALGPNLVLNEKPESSFASLLVAFASIAVWSLLFTPFLIAIHRFIIRDEVTTDYVIDPREPRFQRFFAFSMLLFALVYVPALVMLQEGLLAAIHPLAILAILMFVLVMLFVLPLRMSILFPAIAVDAPGATLANAIHDTKGHAFGILVIFFVASLPFMLADVLWYFTANSGGLIKLAGHMLTSCINLFSTIMFATIASRLF